MAVQLLEISQSEPLVRNITENPVKMTGYKNFYELTLLDATAVLLIGDSFITSSVKPVHIYTRMQIGNVDLTPETSLYGPDNTKQFLQLCWDEFKRQKINRNIRGLCIIKALNGIFVYKAMLMPTSAPMKKTIFAIDFVAPVPNSDILKFSFSDDGLLIGNDEVAIEVSKDPVLNGYMRQILFEISNYSQPDLEAL